MIVSKEPLIILDYDENTFELEVRGVTDRFFGDIKTEEPVLVQALKQNKSELASLKNAEFPDFGVKVSLNGEEEVIPFTDIKEWLA